MAKIVSRLAEHIPTRMFVRVVALQYRLFEPEIGHLKSFVPADKMAIDVGTWWGPWSWWLARRVPHVEAFEPNRAIYDELRPVLPANVTLNQVALSDGRGQSSLWSPSRELGTEGRSSLLAEGHTDWVEQKVETLPLDVFGFSDVGFVKIDVEGYELSVLKGASALLEKERPNVLVEVEQAHQSGTHMDQVFAFLTDLGYQGFFLQRGTWFPLSDFDREEARRLGEKHRTMGLLRSGFARKRYINNFLFLQSDQVHMLDGSAHRKTVGSSDSDIPRDWRGRRVVGSRYARHGRQHARDAWFRFLRRGKYLLGHDPLTLPVLLRLTPMGISRQITEHTDLVVEGFPRAGNTFTVSALQDATAHRIRIASHVHHPAQVKQAVLRGIPTVLLIREPVPMLSSYLTFGQHARPAEVIREYISYYGELIHYVDQVLVADFSETVVNLSSVIERINQRFGMDIPAFDQSSENTERVLDELARYHGLVHSERDPIEVVPRPRVEREQTLQQLRTELLSPQYESLLSRANDLYEFYVSKAEQQRREFERMRQRNPGDKSPC
ncbi:FkbM family methyltransferase [Mycobacterium sp.]|uniref:FkbM family methyltransferase n=1 Tax=Mycobacterium sp. TaxID=1785 RepID=UPI003F999590